jgi:hypothetical protein
VLKLAKNGKYPGQDNINSELYKYVPEELLKFLNNVHRENRIPNDWRNAVIAPIFKTTEELVFLMPAVRYTLKFLI